MVLMLGEYNIDCILENKLKQIMETNNGIFRDRQIYARIRYK